jgi:hypothetical protein
MENLGPILRDWRTGWAKRVDQVPDRGFAVPGGTAAPIGYVLLSFGARDTHPDRTYDLSIQQIPQVYRQALLGQPDVPSPQPDPFQLASLRHYRSLMPLAVSAHKPMFLLRPADGARGAHLDAVLACYDDFQRLTDRISAPLGLTLP